MKKIFRIASIVFTTILLAGCGNKMADEEDVVEIWTSWTDGEVTAIEGEKQIEKFEEETGIKVTQTNFTYDMLHEKILTASAGGNVPDLVWGLPEYIGEFDEMGIIEDVTEEFEEWEEIDNISESVKEAVSIGDRVIGFPYEMTLRAYLVHDTDFEAAGSEVPTTWEELLELSDFIDETGKYPYGIAGKGVRSPQELVVYLAQYDVEIATLQDDQKYKNTWKENKEEMKKVAKVFQFYKDLVAEKIVDPNSANFGWEETDENLAAGITASYVSGNWLQEREETSPEIMKDISVHPIPKPKDGKNATYMEVKPLFLMKDAKNKEGAIELAKAMAGTEWQEKAFADRSPLSNVSTDTKWSKDFDALAEYGVTFPPVALGGINQNLIDALAKVLQEDEDPEVVSEWLSDEINLSLEESNQLSDK